MSKYKNKNYIVLDHRKEISFNSVDLTLKCYDHPKSIRITFSSVGSFVVDNLNHYVEICRQNFFIEDCSKNIKITLNNINLLDNFELSSLKSITFVNCVFGKNINFKNFEKILFIRIRDSGTINFIASKIKNLNKRIEFQSCHLTDYFYYKQLNEIYPCLMCDIPKISDNFLEFKLNKILNYFDHYDLKILIEKINKIKNNLNSCRSQFIFQTTGRSLRFSNHFDPDCFNFEIMKLFHIDSLRTGKSFKNKRFMDFEFLVDKSKFKLINKAKELIKINVGQLLEVWTSIFGIDFKSFKTFSCENIIISKFCPNFRKIVLMNSRIDTLIYNKKIVFKNYTYPNNLEYNFLISKNNSVIIKNSEVCCLVAFSKCSEDIKFKNCTINYTNAEECLTRLIKICIDKRPDCVQYSQILYIFEILRSIKPKNEDLLDYFEF